MMSSTGISPCSAHSRNPPVCPGRSGESFAGFVGLIRLGRLDLRGSRFAQGVAYKHKMTNANRYC
jgi:hypothetical protein